MKEDSRGAVASKQIGASADHIINELFRREEWQKARAVILRELERDKDNHWLLTRLATTYYEEHRYERALEIGGRALRIAPECPLALWDYAGALDMLGREDEAIRVWKKLLARGEEEIAYGDCGEGIRRARSLLNDCRYRIGLAYGYLGRRRVAERYLKEHLANRSPGIPSIYPLALVKGKLLQMQEDRPQTAAASRKRSRSHKQQRHPNNGHGR